MQKLKTFIDTHSKENGTFPAEVSKGDFSGVYEKYMEACEKEGVVIVNTMLSAQDGRMFCVNMAPNADAIKRAHEEVGLPFDSITEVTTTSPGDIYFNWK